MYILSHYSKCERNGWVHGGIHEMHIFRRFAGEEDEAGLRQNEKEAHTEPRSGLYGKSTSFKYFKFSTFA